MPVFNYSLESEEVITTDATVTDLLRVDIDEASAGRLQLLILARGGPAPAPSSTWDADYGFEREPGLDPVILGTGTKSKMASAGATSWDISVTASGGDVLVQVTG